MSNEDIIKLTMEEAEKAYKEGNSPYGVIVLSPDGNIIWRDHDRSTSLIDPTAHGEVNAVRGICKQLGTKKLHGYKFYTNAEPCTVCMASMIRAEVMEVYYGTDTEPNASLPIPVEELAERAKKHKVKVYGGILAEETQTHIDKLLFK